MKSSPHIYKARRNLNALFVLAFLLTLLMSACGGYMLIRGNSRLDVKLTMPAWEYGQFLLMLGLVNLFVYVSLCFQVRRLIRGIGHDNAA
jgi:hypothetical protein